MISKSDFNPPWYLKNPHLQTLLANQIRPPCPEVQERTLTLADGDRLTLVQGSARGPDVLLVLHGLEGSLRSSYARRIINFCNQHQMPVVLMLFRGCDGAPNRLPRSYHSGETGDLRQVVAHLKKNGYQRIALLGYSLGGNVTLKYMGEGSVDDSVMCATAISVPLNLDICAARMDRGFSRIYQHDLLNRLRRKVAEKRDLLIAAGLDVDHKVSNFIEFDDAFTAPLHGFSSGLDYYLECSSRQFLKKIDRPTLIIQAEDDPFMTPNVIPNKSELSDAIELEISAHGGHVGFIERGLFKQKNWLEPRIRRWLNRQFYRS